MGENSTNKLIVLIMVAVFVGLCIGTMFLVNGGEAIPHIALTDPFRATPAH